jgi:uncharacterized protein (DUF1778 family)
MANGDLNTQKRRAVLLRMSDREYELLQREASDRGITICDFMRSVLRVATNTMPVVPVQRRAEG